MLRYATRLADRIFADSIEFGDHLPFHGPGGAPMPVHKPACIAADVGSAGVTIVRSSVGIRTPSVRMAPACVSC